MNLQKLRFFYEAAKCQNFTQAAEKLCVTQPAVTTQVRGLEENLEIKLFKKRGPRVALTDAGVLLLQYAHRVFELEREMEGALAEVRELKRGLLKIATTKTYARYVMPGIIPRFREAYPEIKVILDEGSSRYVCRTLLELENELGVLAGAEHVEGLTFVPFREEAVCLFSSPDHPLAREPSIAFEDLRAQLIIMREEGSSLHALIRDCFRERGMEPPVLLQTSNSDLIKEMVGEREGVAFLVRSAVDREVKKKRLAVIPIRDQALSLKVRIAYLEGVDLSPAAQAFLQILREEPEPSPD